MFDWMAWTTPVYRILLQQLGSCVWHDGVGDQVPTSLHKGFFCPWRRHEGGSLVHWLGVAAYVNLGFSALAASWRVVLMDGDPSIWIGFVLSMALLALVMRKG